MGEQDEGALVVDAPETPLEVSINAHWHAAALGIMAFAVVVTVIALWFRGWLDSGLPVLAVDAMPPCSSQSVLEVTARYRWEAAGLLFLLAGMLGALGGVYTTWNATWRSWDHPKARRWMLATIASVIAAAFFFSLVLPGMDAFREADMVTQLGTWFEGSQWPGFVDAGPVERQRWITKIGHFAAVFVCAGMVTASLVGPKYDRERLETQAKLLRWMLYAASALFVISLFLINSSLHWWFALIGVDTISPPPKGTGPSVLTALIDAATLRSGAAYSLILIAVYLPSALILRHHALGFARKALERTKKPETGVAPSVEAWLSKENLAGTWSLAIVQVMAMMAPLLTGSMGQMLGSLGAFG